MSSPGLIAPTPTAPPAGLINAAPGANTTTPGATPTGNTGPGAPVTSYNPAQATTSAATATPTNVPTNATVQSQLSGIIASGSPLMEQASTNAKNLMNQRGLINSSTALTADQSAVIAAAEPIAAQDAQTYATAAQQTAAAENAARLQNSNLETNTSQFNAGQGNAAFSQASAASNTVAQTAQQIAGSTNIQQIQDATSQAIAQLQAGTSLTTAQISAATSQLVASIQANTSLTNQQQQDLTNTTIAQMNNIASLQQIQAQGSVNTQIAQLNNQYAQLTQTDQAAQTFYSQSLANLANIAGNVNMSEEQKTQALQNGVQVLNDGLAAISQIAGTPDVQSTLSFTGGTTDPTTGDLATPAYGMM
jgi:hypothetical protein